MNGKTPLTRYQEALRRRASWRDARRFLALEKSGELKCAESPSVWQRLIGAPLDQTQQLAAVHDFKSSIMKAYGPLIAKEAFRSIRSRDVLAFSDARAAIAEAEKLSHETQQQNECLVRDYFLSLRPFIQDGNAKQMNQDALVALVNAYLGEEALRARLSANRIQEAVQELCAMVDALTGSDLDALVHALGGLALQEQCRLVHERHRLMFANHADADADASATISFRADDQTAS